MPNVKIRNQHSEVEWQSMSTKGRSLSRDEIAKAYPGIPISRKGPMTEQETFERIQKNIRMRRKYAKLSDKWVA